MSRLHTPVCAATSAPTAFRRQLVLMWAIGTLLPLMVLAGLYLVAPLPMTTAAAEVLRTANRIAALVVLAHWGITLTWWAVTRVTRPAAARAPQGTWQPVHLHARASA